MKGSRTMVTVLVAVASCLSMFVCFATTQADIPDKYTNLKVLPEDISKQELIAVMKTFTKGLGVRCHFCHVGDEGAPLDDYDFAADDKDSKKVAREMMKMRSTINNKLLPELGDLREHSIEVTCLTCHRGRPEPRMLEDVLAEVIEKNGVDAAIVKYRELRDRYYGGFSYDFGEMTLVDVAANLSETDPAGAITILNLNLEFNPESWFTFIQLGETHLAAGEKKEALAAYEKAFEIRPNPRLKKRIDSLKNDG